MNTANTTNAENSAARPGDPNAPLTSRVADGAHEQVDRAARRAAQAEDTIRGRAADSSEIVHEKMQSAKHELDEMTGKIESYARANPVTAAGIAFAAGMVLSSILRR